MEAKLTDIPDKELITTGPVYWRRAAIEPPEPEPRSRRNSLKESFNYHAKRIAFKYSPLTKHLSEYSLPKLIGDVIGGTTVCALRIPQGMAYGTLAGVSAINGLYTELVGPISYAVLGSSPQLSVGTFAVVELMTGGALIKHHESICGYQLPADPVTTDPCSLGIIALMQIMMAVMLLVLRFTKLASYMKILLSKPLVTGYTSAAGIYVVFSQVNNLCGFNSPAVNRTIPRYSETFALGYVLRDFSMQITSIQWFTLAISIFSCVSLYSGKRIHEWYKSKTGSKIAWPLELVLLLITTIVSFLFAFDTNHSVAVVGHIPQGVPPIALKSFQQTFSLTNAKLLAVDAFSILIVNFSIILSLGELFANKFNYKLDPNAEAHGLSLSLVSCSLFGGVTAAGALARSMVQAHSGGYTQIVSFVSSFWLLLVLCFLAPYLFWLPKAVLSSVIVVNLRSLFLKYPDAYENLYKKRRFADFTLFTVTNLSVLVLGLDTGLYIALITELFIIFFQLRASFSLKQTNVGVIPIVSLSGSIFSGNCSETEKQFKELKVTDGMILNCDGLSFVDHTGLDTMKLLLDQFEKVVCADKKLACRMLKVMEGANLNTQPLIQSVRFYPTIADAISDKDNNCVDDGEE